jgi:hypothetical protein
MPLSCIAAALGSKWRIGGADHGSIGARSQSKRAAGSRFVARRRADSRAHRGALASSARAFFGAAEHPNILGLAALAPPLGRT